MSKRRALKLNLPNIWNMANLLAYILLAKPFFKAIVLSQESLSNRELMNCIANYFVLMLDLGGIQNDNTVILGRPTCCLW